MSVFVAEPLGTEAFRDRHRAEAVFDGSPFESVASTWSVKSPGAARDQRQDQPG